jgi:alkylated DNA repair dioxygenase AlkB
MNKVTRELFPDNDQLVCIPMQGAEVYYQSRIALGATADAIMQELIASIPWRAENIVVWGKTYAQPRLTAWYGDEGCDYTYSGIHLMPLPWSALLLDLKRRVESIANTTFNSVLLNYYRDHRDSMGFHSDDESELGEQPVIVSLSLGEERTFIFKHKTAKTVPPVRLKLASGSLLLMKGATQRYWSHGIDKETRLCGPRVNLTFRCIKS